MDNQLPQKITRSLLQLALSVSQSEDLNQSINKLLSSTTDDVITLPNELHNTITIWIPLKPNLYDLDIKYPIGAYEFVSELLGASIVGEDENFIQYYTGGRWSFQYLKESNEFYFDYVIYLILENEFHCNELQINKLITDIVNQIPALK